MKKFKQKAIRVAAVLGSLTFALGVCVESAKTSTQSLVPSAADSLYNKTLNTTINTNRSDYFDPNVVYEKLENIAADEIISVIVTMNMDSVVDVYLGKDSSLTVSEYAKTEEAKSITRKIDAERRKLIKKLNNSGVDYKLGEVYDTVLSGFEISLQARDFEKVGNLLKKDAYLTVGEVYEPAVTEVVTNEVDVYEETGIFTGLEDYKGDGVLVAVLDTGLDYTHSAFDPKNFPDMDVAFTMSDIAEKVPGTVAATLTAGLTAEDVYLNKKVPFAYDYADKDPDVLPINSEHGTHVAGIIAGKDDTITGVAPNAQLAIMKVFSDTQTGAKSSWILAGVEDCVTLGVDVINMSLGSACGFAREEDKEHVNIVYDKVRDAGISLIASAANSYNATISSEKNGSLGLTSNPDSGTVGSPSTYAAALSVASVDGVRTPYLKYGDEIIYFNEASAMDGKKKNFVDSLLKKYEEQTGEATDTHEFEYITIPGIGRESDYMKGVDYTGKIVLVKRGITTFEEKVRIALNVMGATGIIIYNNVSGTIGMSIGDNIGVVPVCSISQDQGELLAANATGKVLVSRKNTAGPFMSDFSSWGPTSDLQIKPEITAHGGEILSAVPGNGYEKLSGTSMAAPNQAGATALIRQYVRYSNIFGDYEKLTQTKAREVTALVNQIVMSTADIVKNKNGLPYAVRKQGAGLVNLNKATTADAYLTTFAKDGSVMDKTKLELGDDKDKTGVYTMKFAINNIRDTALSYDVSASILTEGISETYTSHDEKTVTQDGYLLNPTMSIKEVVGGTVSGNTVTVSGKQAIVTVEVTLSSADKKYLDDNFENGMYVEGFVQLKAKNGSLVDLSVPMLAFYGDWTQAPIFDEEYYDTNKDELNEGLDIQDKVMADAYATRVIGSLYSDYIVTLGAYPFKQDPMATQIAANKDRIAISNQRDESEEGNNSTANAVSDVWAGLLRNAKEVEISIIEDSTGEEVFYRSEKNQHKSYNYSGSIGSSAIEIDFSAIENNLKNNTRYTVTLSAYIDYGTKETQNNKRNTFTFPLYIDIEAPAVTDVRYRSEYDKSTKKTKLYADIDIYDNHYAMGMQIGQIVPSEDPKYTFSMDTFGKYITPVYSTFNSTSTVTVELTDYIDRIKNSIGMDQNSPTASEVEKNNNSFIAVCYDYALNVATYEIRLPDEILSAAFKEDTISLQEGKTKDLIAMMDIYPMDSWAQTLDFVVENPLVAEIVNGTVIAKQAGETVIRAIKKDGKDNQIEMASVNLVVTSKSGGFDGITEPVNKFELTGYYTNKAYHGNSNDDREIGETDSNNAFGKDGAVLSMFPSESVTVQYTLDSYFPDDTKVVFESMNEEVATVDPETGTIIAQKKGTTYISADVYFREDGEWDTTFYSAIITVKVKDPFTVNGMYLYSYKGLGGVVEIPDDRSITMIYQYAFSNYEYIPKDENDVIDEEDPYFIKPWYIGEDTITKVIIPEGITTIESYAFASLTALEEVVLPKSLVRIGVGAFTGCTKLRKINLENVKFINEEAFKDCPLSEVALDSVVSIGNYTFQNTEITSLHLPESSQSLGIGAFADNTYLYDVSFAAAKMKIGSRAFENCKILNNITVNAAVIASYAFYNCEELDTITLGKDVAIIGEFAFTGTNIAQFNVEDGSQIIVDPENKACLLKDGELIMIAPKGATYTFTTSATTIAAGALAGNTKIEKVVAKEVETIGSYAFAECPNLEEVDMPAVKSIGDYAFAGTKLKQMPTSKDLTKIGNYAFAGTLLKEVKLVDNAVVGEYAFGGYETVSRYVTETLEKVEIGNGVKLGKGVFYAPIYLATYDNVDSLYYYDAYQYYLQDKDGNYIDKDGNIVSDKSQAKSYTYYRYDYKTSGIIPSVLTSISIGENVIIGENAFAGNAKIKELTIGNGSVIEDYAFMNAAFYDETVLNSIDLSGVVKIGQYAFSGTSLQDYQEIETLGKTEDEPITSIVPAYNLVYVPDENGKEGEEKILGYKLSNFAPIFKEVDLSGTTELGEGAFAYNKNLEKVTFNDSLTSIPSYAFALCSALESVELPASVASIGEYAFYLTGLVGDTLNLQNVDVIGDYAFAQTGLTNVSFKDGATIGEAAFNGCGNLTGADISNVLSIGASAFRETALTKADLTSAEYVGDFAFGESKVTEVVFGTNIKEFGENPFYGCAMETYGKEESVEFNGAVISTTIVDTYKINDKVEIIDGVLYQKVKTGLELISYPMLKEDKTYKVVEGTARITARAFYGSKIENVTLPLSLKALGDKAFFDCNSLSVVVFKSYDAPILEEDYDTSRLAYENLPMTGRIGEYVGLGIVKYYMWNPTAQFTNFYFGANFVDFIGDVDGDLVMVKPANGRKYNTFIFSQYFKTVVEGSNAATDETINVIALINAIPSRVSLTDEETIVTAREAYDKITSFEQRALIAEVYPKLSNAESTLEYLKANAGQGDSSDSSEPEDSSTDSTVSSGEQSDANVSTNTNGYVVAIVCLSIAVVGVGCFAIFAFMRKGAGASKETENSGDNADEVNNSDNQE